MNTDFLSVRQGEVVEVEGLLLRGVLSFPHGFMVRLGGEWSK
jgi:hypothetical protein